MNARATAVIANNSDNVFDATPFRSGRYVNQAAGYRAFIPEPLPPNPTVRIEGDLYKHPIISVNEAQDLIGTTYQAANDLVSKFVDIGILTEITGQLRNRRFMYGRYINLFHDDAAQAES